MAVTLRLATETDARLLSELGARLFEQSFGADNKPHNMERYLTEAFSVERQRAELADPDSRIWFAEDGETAIGYVSIRRRAAPPAVHSAQSAEIARIYVDAASHGRGVGALMLNACVEQARAWGADSLWLGVWDRNAHAIEFYERFGFRCVGSQRFQLGDDAQTDYIMARRID